VYSFRMGEPSSHLPTIKDDHVHVGNVFSSIAGLGLLHLAYDIHPTMNFAENHMLVVEEGRWDCGNEKL